MSGDAKYRSHEHRGVSRERGRQRGTSAWLRWPLVGLLLAAGAGCDSTPTKPASAKPAAASKVEKLPGEAELTTVTLAPEAEERLGIATVEVERKPVARARTLGGELMVPPGRTITVAAPMGGTLNAPADGVPVPGTPVARGRVVFRLVPLLSPEARATMATTLVEAQGQVDQAEKQLEQAKIQLDRAERLRRENLGSAGALIDAKAQYDVAESTRHAAEARRDALRRTTQGLEGGTLDPLPIEVEADGILRNLHALAGQVVASGAPLFDVIRTDPLHLRVPVYVGDLAQIDAEAPAVVGGLSDAQENPTRSARPVPAPPAGDPLAATVDLFYAVENSDGALRPGQRVGVTLPLRGQRESLVVPRAALLRDFDGGTWVYVAPGDHKFTRRRVRLERIAGSLAVLGSGPEPGTRVVTDGAAELFGIEFGGAK